MLFGVGAFGDGDGVEVAFPELTEEAFLGVEEVVGEVAGGHARGFVGQGYELWGVAVVEVAVAAAAVVEDEALVGKAVGEVMEGHGEDVGHGVDHGEVGAVLGALKAYELEQAVCVVAHGLAGAHHGEYVGVGEVALLAGLS